MNKLNVLPRDHVREDYDFSQHPVDRPEDAYMAPIRLSGGTIWCRVHGWEQEILPDSWISKEVAYSHPFIYRWTCPTCGRSRNAKITRGGRYDSKLIYSHEMALKCVWSHIRVCHDGIVPYRRIKWTSDADEDQRMFVR